MSFTSTSSPSYRPLSSIVSNRFQSISEIWSSEQAERVRAKVRNCPKNCWMVGTASPVMHKYISRPMKWALTNKLRVMRGLEPCLDKKWEDVGQDPTQGDLKPRK